VRSRAVPPEVVDHYKKVAEDLEPNVLQVLKAEAVARADALAQREAGKVENMIKHGDEIASRPARQWPVRRGGQDAEASQKDEADVPAPPEKRPGQHRMSSKKRKMQEARAETRRFVEEQRREEEEVAKSGNKKRQEPGIQSKTKKKKAKGDEEEVRKKKKKPAAAKTPAARALEFLGDGGLFEEANVMYEEQKLGLKKQNKEEETRAAVPQSYRMREYDPNKKLGKKRGNKAFKSKAKFKRKK